MGAERESGPWEEGQATGAPGVQRGRQAIATAECPTFTLEDSRWRCSLCNKLISYNYRGGHADRHMARRPHACEVPGCERKFASKREVIAHSVVHSDAQPIACEVPGCSSLFKRPESRHQHYFGNKMNKGVHSQSELDNAGITKGQWGGSRKRPRPEGDSGPISSSSAGAGSQHVARIQAGNAERPHRCPVEGCGKNFKSENNLRTHLVGTKAHSAAELAAANVPPLKRRRQKTASTTAASPLAPGLEVLAHASELTASSSSSAFSFSSSSPAAEGRGADAAAGPCPPLILINSSKGHYHLQLTGLGQTVSYKVTGLGGNQGSQAGQLLMPPSALDIPPRSVVSVFPDHPARSFDIPASVYQKASGAAGLAPAVFTWCFRPAGDGQSRESSSMACPIEGSFAAVMPMPVHIHLTPLGAVVIAEPKPAPAQSPVVPDGPSRPPQAAIGLQQEAGAVPMSDDEPLPEPDPDQPVG
jgi:hypothetical protein